MTAALLEVSDVSVRFGGVWALRNLSVRLDGGGIVGLIGANGAGKTTLINVVTGAVRPAQGRVLLDGHDLTAMTAHRAARLGLARTFQNIQLFGSLSVLDNVLMPYRIRHRSTLRQGRARALALLEQVGLADRADGRPYELAYGQQRRLELARALAMAPRLILLDEPLAGMAGRESEEMLTLFGRLREQRVTLLLVEHDVASVLRISDRVLVLDHGRLLADAPAAEVVANPAVRTAYLGDAMGADD
ncbi:ABC transporter ATP-binding protein [Actinoplanes sp. NPDC049596]|uniref:ABC transporter ATP-binding protein n=1 Tax=unclassified Actinoplanes TaxID=2626549 RepID=UPI00342E8894